MGANAFKVCESEMLLLEKTQTGILKPKKKKKMAISKQNMP